MPCQSHPWAPFLPTVQGRRCAQLSTWLHTRCFCRCTGAAGFVSNALGLLLLSHCYLCYNSFISSPATRGLGNQITQDSMNVCAHTLKREHPLDEGLRGSKALSLPSALITWPLAFWELSGRQLLKTRTLSQTLKKIRHMTTLLPIMWKSSGSASSPPTPFWKYNSVLINWISVQLDTGRTYCSYCSCLTQFGF